MNYEQLGLHANTLRKYADEGSIEIIKTPSGQRKYNVDKFLGVAGKRSLVCYCHVSNYKQKDDLQRQNAVRINKSLGDLVGLKNIGFHIIYVESGKDTTEYHKHYYEVLE